MDQELRRRGIGGTDIAAICGVSPWRTPMQVWLEKRGEAAPVEENEAMYWGSQLEPLVAAEYARRTGRKVRRQRAPIFHRKIPYIFGHIDGFSLGEDRRVLEVKTARTDKGWGDPGTDEIPDAYLVQVQWYLGLTRLELADVAFLCAGQDFRIYQVRRDNGLIAHLLDVAARFWQSVQEGNAPAPESRDEALARWPRGARGKSVIVGPETAQLCSRLADVAAEQRKLADLKDKLEAQLMAAFGEAEEITYMGERLATWRTQTASRVDVKRLREEAPDVAARYTITTESRVLRLVKRRDDE